MLIASLPQLAAVNAGAAALTYGSPVRGPVVPFLAPPSPGPVVLGGVTDMPPAPPSLLPYRLRAGA